VTQDRSDATRQLNAIPGLRELGVTDELMADLLASVRLYSGSSGYDLTLTDLPSTDRLRLEIRIVQGREIRVHIPRSPKPAARALASLPAVLDLTTWPSRIPRALIEYLEWDDKSQSWRYGHQTYTGVWGYGPVEFVSQIWVGMAALWFLGKLADAYATRLADWMAETTIAALRRVRTTKSGKRELVVIKVPKGVTVMILPKGKLTEAAREAFIDLDPNADGISGELLSWNPKAGRWLPESDAIPHPPPDA
jgi:hypothetical protein